MYSNYGAILNHGNDCPHCLNVLSHGHPILEPHYISHCSAYMISKDLTHVSILPVNCTAKYWNRVLCVRKSNESNHKESACNSAGKGEYVIQQNKLIRSDYVCPGDYKIVIYGMCMKLTQIPNIMLQHGDTYNLMKIYNYKICNKSNLFTDIPSSELLDIDLIHDVLEEFYAKGSELFLGEKINPYRYVWFPPPLYATYMPCFSDRRKISGIEITQYMAVYTCEDGSVIPNALLCNRRSDCMNSEDEQNCSVCTDESVSVCFETCTFPDCHCSMFYYQCQSGGCVHYDHVCDAVQDCPGGEDEHACPLAKTFPKFSEVSIRKSHFTGLCDPPIENMLMCRSQPQCYNSSAICHYDHSDGVMAHCEDGSHLGSGSFCQYVECPQQYKCSRSYCIPSRKLCNGVIDCPTGDDEVSCVDYKCPGHMRCSGVHFCVPLYEICDGLAHCPGQDDEKFCQIYPSGCNCEGTAVYCQDVKDLTFSGVLQSPSALILYNSFDIFIDIYNQYVEKMQHVWLIDLKHGSFASLLHNEKIQSFLFVKILYLNHQGLDVIPRNFINAPNMTYVNLSHNAIHSVKRNAFSLMKHVIILSLAKNKLQALESYFSLDLKFLSHLFLNGNQLVNIAADVFQQNEGLVLVRSDWYMVCCVVIEVKDCKPQNQFVSSCSHLIASVVQRAVIIIQGILVIISNLGGLLIQFALVHSNIAEKYLIICLSFADLLMGVYLLAIAYVDLSYRAIFHQIISEWTDGLTCLLFGLLNFISSEVSLITLSLLSFARATSIDKVGGMSLMKSKIRIACICIWLLIVVIGIFYVVFTFTNNTGLRNNMCIFFGVSQRRVITNFERIFQITFICLNFMLLNVLSISMFGIMYIVAKSSHAISEVSGKKSEKLQQARLHRTCFKLSLLLVCNVFTWLPFLVVSVLLLSGIDVHEYVLQWVIVLGIPLCATTDPILYNLARLKSFFETFNKK